MFLFCFSADSITEVLTSSQGCYRLYESELTWAFICFRNCSCERALVLLMSIVNLSMFSSLACRIFQPESVCKVTATFSFHQIFSEKNFRKISFWNLSLDGLPQRAISKASRASAGIASRGYPLKSECKVTAFLFTHQIFHPFFCRKIC